MPFLHEIQEAETAAQVATCYRNHQAQVAFDQPSAGLFAILGQKLELDAPLGVERLVGGGQLAQSRLAGLESLCKRHLLLSRQQLVVSDLAQVHGAGTARQLFGQQPEATDRLGHGSLRFSFSISPLGRRAEELFVLLQKIKTHCVWLLLGPMSQGSKKPP